jgi:hypothetical protein
MSTAGRALLMRVCAELGAGNITEAYIRSEGEYCEGLTEPDGAITINPTHAVVDAVIHECLHRMFWRWSEAKVRAKTRTLRKLMTDDETVAFYKEYQRRRRKTQKRVKAN